MKKKAIIFTTIAGGGQASVTEALQTYLQKDYQVRSVGTFSQILSLLDPMYIISFGYTSGETIYNYLIQKQHNKLTNVILYTGARWYFRLLEKKIETLLQKYIKQEKPAVIISVIPFINNALAQVAKKNKVPFVLFPPDFDITMYLHLLQQPPKEYFYIALPLETKKIDDILEKHMISSQSCIATGYPLRPAFTQEHDTTHIKKTYKIPENKPVILILLGSLGSEKLPELARHLTHITHHVHYIFCTGQSKTAKNAIETIPFPSQITKTVLGFTQEIDKIIAISDIFITKSGSVSVAEALYMHIPLLLDATSDVLVWEQYNHVLVKKYNVGTSIHSYKHALQVIDNLLNNPEKIATYKENSKKLDLKNGGLAFKQLIDQITTKKPKK